MSGSRRPRPLEPNRVVVWITDGTGTIFGCSVSTIGDAREWAARAWLHFLKHPLCCRLVTDSTVFDVVADGKKARVSVADLWSWFDAVGSPREQSLKHDLRALLKKAGWARA